MKRALFFICYLVFILFSAFAQISDHFYDGDFTNNPAWTGDTNLFIINTNHQLQLNAEEAGTAFLSLPTTSYENEHEWHFFIRLAFSPSNNNYARVYLSADTTNLKSSNLKGYFLQFGENLANDAIELFYQQGSQLQSICRGVNGKIANAFSINVKVLFTDPGHWQVFVDEEMNGLYLLECEGFSIPQITHKAMGVFCQYTSTNRNRFYFDDFYYGTPVIDTVPPVVMSVEGEDDLCSVIITFSENVSPETALSLENYTINGQHQPAEALFNDSRLQSVKIRFSSTFQERIVYQLHISGITDLAGNLISPDNYDFMFVKIKRHDILITEIMANPSNANQLPNCEYVELHNYGIPIAAVLKGWKLKIGTRERMLPELTIPPKGYLFLVPQSCLEQFEGYPNVFPVSSLTIANDGQQLVLLDANNTVIHEVTFHANWHSYKPKRDGGWSLEMIDTDNPCSGEENWDSSISFKGGTPGEPNSIAAINPDYHPPEIEKITVQDSITLFLYFTETVFKNPNNEIPQLKIDQGIDIIAVEELPPENMAWKIKLSKPLVRQIIYTLTFMDTTKDCANNPLQLGSQVQLAMPEQVQPFDIVINEILTNAYGSSRAEFIEIYNRSEKVIDLGTIRIGSGGVALPDKSIIVIGTGFQLFPHTMVAICRYPKITQEQYYVPYPKRLIKCDTLPSYANASGIIYLTDLNYTVIDRLSYNKSMHYSMLNSVEGVSLERIYYDVETQNDNNWKSAAASVGYATPCYQNSQSSEYQNNEEQFEIIPDIFSPNGDGFDDFTTIYCRFLESENRVTITIYDRSGFVIKRLVNNQPCSMNELFIWDGTTEKGILAPQNLYVVQIDYWNINGKMRSTRKSVGVIYK